MAKKLLTGLVAVALVALIGSAYVYGRWTAQKDASAYLYDVSTHLALSCTNEHVVTLTDLREGRTSEAVRGLELLVAAKLEQLDVSKIPFTTVSKKSLEDLRAPLLAYQTKFPTKTLDPKSNARLKNVLRALK